jgi:Putative MetA-pathway of phenol degradation
LQEDSSLLLFVQRKLWKTLALPRAPLRITVVFVALFSGTTRAQSPGPRDFLNTPVNQTIAWVDYVATSAATVSVDLPLPNNESVGRVVAPTILASFPFQNRYAGVSLTVPYSKVEVDGPAGKVETSGFNDPAIAVHANIFGLPALRRDQIAEWDPHTFLTFHLTVNPPLGEYDRNAPVNTGANRWAFTPLLNLNIPLNKGATWVEVYGWGRFFTNNDEFQGNNLLSQHPLGSVAAWYSHNLGKKMYAAIGGYYDYGGETFVNHIPQNDTANGFRGSVGISRRFGTFRVGFRYENTASKPNASPSSALLLLKVSFPPLFRF